MALVGPRCAELASGLFEYAPPTSASASASLASWTVGAARQPRASASESRPHRRPLSVVRCPLSVVRRPGFDANAFALGPEPTDSTDTGSGRARLAEGSQLASSFPDGKEEGCETLASTRGHQDFGFGLRAPCVRRVSVLSMVNDDDKGPRRLK